ncbi:hypothetical protein [Thermicanus aegyptius]|uniref:hypothetical protein n=1 Tax=Thermicanus aegyptius TaxID=94009 RepID=UPI0004244BAA|nr:hypothetical protein [Thermicanus aegyptius]
MGTWRILKFVGDISQLNEFREDLLRELNAYQTVTFRELNAYQTETDVRRIMPKDVDKVMNIFRENTHGYVKILGKCGKEDKGKIIKMVNVDFKFFRRKRKIGVRAYFYIFEGLCVNRTVFFTNRKSFEDMWEVIGDVMGLRRSEEIRNYLSYRKRREMLLKAAKCGIEVDELRANIREKHLVDFKEPCFLLVSTITKRILHTPYGKFEIKRFTKDARNAFLIVTGARRVPYGKNAMKKIEALLLQASL